MSETATPSPPANPPAAVPPIASPRIAEYGALIVSGLVLFAFFACVLVAWLTKDSAMFGQLVNSIVVLTSTVVAYWVGSSKSSFTANSAVSSALGSLTGSTK